jgi:hypothetical protein
LPLPGCVEFFPHPPLQRSGKIAESAVALLWRNDDMKMIGHQDRSKNPAFLNALKAASFASTCLRSLTQIVTK